MNLPIIIELNKISFSVKMYYIDIIIKRKMNKQFIIHNETLHNFDPTEQQNQLKTA